MKAYTRWLSGMLLAPMFVAGGCIKLDSFLFSADRAESIDDYHGLPVYQGANPPAWAQVAVEKEIYLRPGTAEVISPDQTASEAEYIHGVFVPAPTGCPVETCPLIDQDVTFLYQHGGGETLFYYWYRAVSLWSLGANVFIYSYRGYGLSEGEVSGDHVLEDAGTALTYVLGRPEVDPARVVLYGWSMGGIPTSWLAGEQSGFGEDVAGVILEAPLDSPASQVALSTGVAFPAGFFASSSVADWNGPAYIQGVTAPVLHMHGAADPRVIRAQADFYYDVLSTGGYDYTHYIGKTSDPTEAWVALAHHRNLPDVAITADGALSAYWDAEENPGHCCIHPDEFLDPQNEAFLEEVGGTTGEEAFAARMRYQQLIAGWALEHVF